jgi:hypothetical protein
MVEYFTPKSWVVAKFRKDVAPHPSGLILDEGWALIRPVPQPMPRADVVKMLKGFKDGLPDFACHLSNVSETAGQITGTMKVTGTHTKTLDLSFLGIPPQPATGKEVQMPAEPIKVDFMGDKLSQLYVQSVEGGGVMGLLNQIGASIEAPA